MPTPIETNTSTMQALLEKIAGKAAGGGGGAVETCTVTITSDEDCGTLIYFDNNNSIKFADCANTGEVSISDMGKGLYMIISGYETYSFTCENAELVSSLEAINANVLYALRITGNAVITMIDN